MLKLIRDLGSPLNQLKEEGLIEEVYSRKIIPEVNYNDIVPLFSDKVLEDYKVKRPLHVGGKGFSRIIASYSCFGEIIERVSLMKERDVNDFNLKKVNLIKFFSHEEIKKYKLKEKMILPSLLLNSLNNKKIFVPAEIIFPNCSKTLLPKCSSSVGTAFEINKDKAILGGILELIERHVILYNWYNDLEIPLINNLAKDISFLINRLKKILKADVSLHALNTDIPCNVISCKIKFGKLTVFGCAASLDSKEASKKAISEALQLYVSSKYVKSSTKNILEQHFIKLLKDPSLLFNDNKKIDCENYKIKDLMNYFKNSKTNVYYKDMTIKELSRYGKVYKVFIPKLLQFGSKNSILFKTNYKLIKGRNEKMINPFV